MTNKIEIKNEPINVINCNNPKKIITKTMKFKFKLSLIHN
jgi:hypothetical protein